MSSPPYEPVGSTPAGAAAPQHPAPPPPAPAGPGPASPPPAPAGKKAGWGMKILAAVAAIGVVAAVKFGAKLLVVLGLAVGANALFDLDLRAGDCLDAPKDVDDTRKVGCGDAAAAFRVDSRVESVVSRSAGDTACGSAVTNYLWVGKSDKPEEKGYVLCLTPAK